jgi:hypothetical protein
VRLPNQIVERLGPVFSGENFVTHAFKSSEKVDSRKPSELMVGSR